MHFARSSVAAAAAAALFSLAGCGGGSTNVTIGAGDYTVNVLPSFVNAGSIVSTTYDGTSDDLLTAGLGRAGLGSAVAPTLSATPTAAELRKLAIHTNYRALVDTTAGGGYGTLYGPNVSAEGVAGTGDGKIAGTETLAYTSGNVTMMVQVPATFSASAPCIITAPSSGSRGVYGAIGTAGEWGLKRGCAVAYTDKGTGNGVHDLQNNTVNLLDGRRADATAAGAGSNFTATLTAAERTAFNTATPNRFAVKHAHSQTNPEKDWGTHTLQAVEFAFYVLNQRFGAELPDGRRTVVVTPANTLVIASSVSNGAAASLAAAEQDTAGWIDGIAVSEPNVNVANGTAGVRVERGASIYTAGSKPLYDYFTLANQLQPCAALAPSVAVASPFAFTGNNATIAALRCEALAAQGLVTGTTAAERGADALNTLIAYGWEPETAVLQASHWLFATPGIAVTYANTYGQFSVRSNTCGFSFGSVDASGVPIAAAPAAIAGVFGTGNGVPPSGALQLIWNDSVGGARNHIASVSPSGKADFALPGANCLRGLWTAFGADALAVRAGVAAVQRSANLRGKPTIIVHGRSDTLIPPNFSSRPYVARNRAAEGAASRVRYIEVTNAQHFDAFLPFAGYDTRYVPLHLYFNRAMDAMWAHLKNGAALPPSQVVRTTPRGGTPGAAPAITAANVPAIAASPAAGALITVTDDGSTIRIPD